MLVVSRVCAVAQYAVLEANAKVNGRGQFSHRTPPKPLNQFRCHDKYITRPQRVDVPNLAGIYSAVTDLRMPEKNTFCVDFFITGCAVAPSPVLTATGFVNGRWQFSTYTTAYTDEEMERFYQDLSQAVTQVPSAMSSAVGLYGLGETNEDGEQLEDFCL